MDKIDYKILSLLQKNGRMLLKEIANEVYLSSPATAARIAKLEEDGIITGYFAKIDYKKMGYQIVAFINLELDPKRKDEFYPYIKQCNNVLECDCVTGHYSMLLKVAFKATEELDGFIGKLQKYGNTETQIVFSTAKEEYSVKL